MENDAGEARVRELLYGGGAPLLVSGCQDDGDAVAGQLPAHLQPDPFVPAGDNGNPTRVEITRRPSTDYTPERRMERTLRCGD